MLYFACVATVISGAKEMIDSSSSARPSASSAAVTETLRLLPQSLILQVLTVKKVSYFINNVINNNNK